MSGTVDPRVGHVRLTAAFAARPFMVRLHAGPLARIKGLGGALDSGR